MGRHARAETGGADEGSRFVQRTANIKHREIKPLISSTPANWPGLLIALTVVVLRIRNYAEVHGPRILWAKQHRSSENTITTKKPPALLCTTFHIECFIFNGADLTLPCRKLTALIHTSSIADGVIEHVQCRFPGGRKSRPGSQGSGQIAGRDVGNDRMWLVEDQCWVRWAIQA